MFYLVSALTNMVYVNKTRYTISKKSVQYNFTVITYGLTLRYSYVSKSLPRLFRLFCNTCVSSFILRVEN